MKITSGKYKYRKLDVPRGIRPTTEKVREAVFSMVQPWLAGAAVLDLFAGSGAMGLEALSRGAERCWFCESDRINQKILSSNIAHCGAGSEAVVIGRDFRAAVAELADASEDVKLDVVIMDPPYSKTGYYETAMLMLQDAGLLGEGSIVVAEHFYDNKLSDTYGKLKRIKEKRYGSIGVDVFML